MDDPACCSDATSSGSEGPGDPTRGRGNRSTQQDINAARGSLQARPCDLRAAAAVRAAGTRRDLEGDGSDGLETWAWKRGHGCPPPSRFAQRAGSAPGPAPKPGVAADG